MLRNKPYTGYPNLLTSTCGDVDGLKTFIVIENNTKNRSNSSNITYTNGEGGVRVKLFFTKSLISAYSTIQGQFKMP